EPLLARREGCDSVGLFAGFARRREQGVKRRVLESDDVRAARTDLAGGEEWVQIRVMTDRDIDDRSVELAGPEMIRGDRRRILLGDVDGEPERRPVRGHLAAD